MRVVHLCVNQLCINSPCNVCTADSGCTAWEFLGMHHVQSHISVQKYGKPWSCCLIRSIGMGGGVEGKRTVIPHYWLGHIVNKWLSWTTPPPLILYLCWGLAQLLKDFFCPASPATLHHRILFSSHKPQHCSRLLIHFKVRIFHIAPTVLCTTCSPIVWYCIMHTSLQVAEFLWMGSSHIRSQWLCFTWRFSPWINP